MRDELVNDVKRCLTCRHKPCQEACPAHIDIPNFIKALKEDDLEKAHEIISASTNLSTICSIVCPHERQCKGHCTLGIRQTEVNISELEHYVSKQFIDNESFADIPSNHHKVAIVGGGPSGISCAKELLKMGYEVSIYDANKELGGVIRYGIPNFRLDNELVDNEVKSIINDPKVELHLNTIVGKDVSAETLLNEYEAVYLACGLNKPKTMGIEDGDIKNIYRPDLFLAYCNGLYDDPFLDELFNTSDVKIGVVGGGDVAMDCARSSKKRANDVKIIYRRDFEQMPATRKELEDAKSEQIEFLNLTNPVKIVKNNDKLDVECVKMELVESEDGGRKRPVAIDNSNFNLDLDLLVMSLGMDMSDNLKKLLDAFNVKYDYKVMVNNYQTSNPKVFAGGDIVDGEQTVVRANVDGKIAAHAIDEFINAD